MGPIVALELGFPRTVCESEGRGGWEDTVCKLQAAGEMMLLRWMRAGKRSGKGGSVTVVVGRGGEVRGMWGVGGRKVLI